MSKAILKDNDSRFLELIVRETKKIDSEALINIVSVVHSHQIDIQTSEHLKYKLFSMIRNLHSNFGLIFKATEFIKNKKTIISFQLSDL